jgi:hypothetical protein
MHWIQPFLAGFAILLAGPAANGAPLPVSIDAYDGHWRPEAVRAEVAPGITFEAVVTHVGAPDRLILFSSRKTDDQPGSLAAFAQRLKNSFTAFHCADLTEMDSTRMGFAGRDLRFELANATLALDCELFVFAGEESWWGVLYAKPRNAPMTAEAAFSLLHKNAPQPPDVVALAPVRVKGIPVSDFPISLEIIRNPAGDRVAEIVVSDVPAGSATEQAGVRVGDAIVAIDGRKTGDFAAGLGKDDELGRIFLNRTPGETVRLEIQPADSRKPFSVTLRAQARYRSASDIFSQMARDGL